MKAFIRSKIAEEELLGMIHSNSEILMLTVMVAHHLITVKLIDEVISIKRAD